MAQGVPLKTA